MSLDKEPKQVIQHTKFYSPQDFVPTVQHVLIMINVFFIMFVSVVMET